MRVLAITPWFPTKNKPASGIFTVRDVELLQRDNEVTVLHLVNPSDTALPQSDFPGIQVITHPYSFLSPRSVWSATKMVKSLSGNADLVHSMAMSSLLPVFLSRPKLPWVHTEHFSELVNPTLPWARRILLGALKNLYRCPTETVAVGKQLAEVIDRYRTWPTWVIGNFVRFGSSPQKLEASSGSVRIFSIGGLISRKGILESIETVAALRARGIAASLKWAGTGELQQQAEALITELGLQQHVTLLGHVSPEELSTYFEEADVFLLPTEAETFGVVFAEALAHGVPVVTSGSGGHLDFLPPTASRVVGVRGAEPLADAIVDLLADPGLLTATQIVDYAAEAFSESARQDAYRAVYREASNRTG